jgi:hypothetical protein
VASAKSDRAIARKGCAHAHELAHTFRPQNAPASAPTRRVRDHALHAWPFASDNLRVGAPTSRAGAVYLDMEVIPDRGSLIWIESWFAMATPEAPLVVV